MIQNIRHGYQAWGAKPVKTPTLRFGELLETPRELITELFVNLHFQDTLLRNMAQTLRTASPALREKWKHELHQVHSADVAAKIEKAVMDLADAKGDLFPPKKPAPQDVRPFSLLGGYLTTPWLKGTPAEEDEPPSPPRFA